MTLTRRIMCSLTIMALLAGQSVLAHASGQGVDVAGVITEIKIGRGRVEVRPAGAMEWRQAEPLLSLRAGDAVRTTENAWAVIVFSGGRGTVKVEAVSSPLVVPAQSPAGGKIEKLQGMLEASFSFLSWGTKDSPLAPLGTRGSPKPPVILAPRNSPVLPGALTFEWLGSEFSRYTIRIVGPAGLVLERPELRGAKFIYPLDAPPLAPGVRYTVQVLSGAHPPQEAWFEVLDPTRAQTIRRDLLELEQTAGAGVSPNSVAALRIGFLASQGLIHDARLSLIAALKQDPDEPTLHFLLGLLYTKAGLPELAAEAYDEAQFLTTDSAKRRIPANR